MLLTTYKPASNLSYLLDTVFKSNWDSNVEQNSSSSPNAYVSEKEGKYFVEIELPGVKKEDIAINIENAVLAVKATRKRNDKELIYERNFKLANELALENVSATYEDGVLTLSINRKEEAAPKRIEIQ